MPDGATGVILSGGSGWLGSHVLTELVDRRVHVVSVGRTPPARSDVCHIAMNLEGYHAAPRRELAAAMQGAQRWVFVHAAGLAHVQKETAEMQRQLWRVNSEGTQRVIDLCHDVGIQRVLYVSSTAVYGRGLGGCAGPLREEDPTNPDTAYGESKLAAEQAVRGSQLDWRIVRPATLFGAGDSANFLRLATAIRRRLFVIPGNGEARKSCLPVDLAAQCIVALANQDAPVSRLLNLGLSDAPTLREICSVIANACQVPPPRSLPQWAVACAGLIGDAVGVCGIRSPLTSATLKKLCSSTWVDCVRASQLFPVIAQTTFESAMRHCASYYRGG
jgi:nucleoside-diphosphate-sugar epimerase